ncbi:MAG: PIN domain-containing protein, partial [Gracilimonas sp.]
MFRLLIDTSVWLDIAKNTQGEKVLGLLEEFLDSEEVSLISPNIILSEFDRNKERVVSTIGSSFSSHLKKVKEIVQEYGDQEYKSTVLSELNNIDHKLPTFEEDAFNSIQRIQELLAQSEKIEPTDNIKLRAAQRAIEKKAPFHL